VPAGRASGQPSGPSAQPPAGPAASPGFRELVDRARRQFALPALAAALVRGGEIAEQDVEGVRETGKEEPASLGDTFHIGSCVKPMTADLVAELVEQGKLAWDRRLADLLPDLAAAMRPEYRAVTVAQLLSHHAGIQPYTDIDEAELHRLAALPGSPTEQRRAFVAEALRAPPVAPVGAEQHYSNAGYVIAGYLAERAAGVPWESLLRSRLLDPLGMSSCHPGPPAAPGRAGQPRGHHAGDQGLVVEPLGGDGIPPAFAPAGDLSCSIADLARFAAFHLAGIQGKSTLLSRATLLRLHTPVEGGRTGSGLGWGINDSQFGGLVSGILGSAGAFTALLLVSPEKGLAVAVATNVGEEGPGRPGVIAAAKLIFERESAPPARSPATTAARTRLD
jgi:CubicO group peptidase (beta-lactamase class C family)